MAYNGNRYNSSITAPEKSDQKMRDDVPACETVCDGGQDVEKDQKDTLQVAVSADRSPTLASMCLVGLGIWFAVFLVALDQTIVANAIPRITDDFQKLSDVGWYGSGYLLTTAAFQLFYGRVYSNFSVKYTFITAVSIFELGSLICGVAPTSTALIIGRAVAGLGGAGIASGALIIIAHSVPLRIRPMFTASMGLVYAMASVLGPLLGGLFTSKLTWRWCFYINLPFGGLTILVILLFLKPIERPELNSVALVEKLKRIDVIGLLIFIPAIVSLLLALQWAGSIYSWNDGRIIALLVLFGALGIVFLGFEYWKGAEATLPVRMLARRSIAAATWLCFCNGAAFLTFIYYIPFWQQVIRNVGPVESGIGMLPLILGVVIMSILSGAFVSKFGYYAPMMILASVIAPIGEGLMTTWSLDTSFSQWVGYQALAGIGIGLGQQQPFMAVQTVLSKSEIASGTSIVMLMQTISGSIFVSIGQSVLQNALQKNLQIAFPNNELDTFDIANIGATQVWSVVPTQHLRTVLVAYNSALTKVFTVGLCMSALTIIGSLSIEWKSVKKAKEDE